MDTSVRHVVTYGTERDVPISLVAHSLLANERLLIESMRLLERISPSFKLGSISVRVAEISNSSPLREVFIASLVVYWQEDLAKEVPDLIEKLTGAHVPDNMDSLVTTLVVAIALYAVSNAIERFMPGKSAKKLIEEYERKKDRISELTGVSKEAIERYSEERVAHGGMALFDKALNFFAPAKLDPGVSILLPNGETIGPDVIDEIPLRGDVNADEKQDAYELSNVVVDIHRSDMDEKKYGWRAVVPVVSDKKVRMELGSSVDQASLYGVRQLVGDVVVLEGMDDMGGTEVKKYQLIRVHSNNA